MNLHLKNQLVDSAFPKILSLLRWL